MGNLENSLNATEIELLEQQITNNSECVIVKISGEFDSLVFNQVTTSLIESPKCVAHFNNYVLTLTH